MAKFKGWFVKNLLCDVRGDGGYEEADVAVNQAMIDLQKSGARIVDVSITSVDRAFPIFTIMYEGEVDILDDDPAPESGAVSEAKPVEEEAAAEMPKLGRPAKQ